MNKIEWPKGLSKSNQKRLPSFYDEEGRPKKIRIYYQEGVADCWTIVFTGNYRKNPRDEYLYLGASDNPYHPQGIGQHGSSSHPLDRPKYSHLGKKRTFDQMPDRLKDWVREEYAELWGFIDDKGNPI